MIDVDPGLALALSQEGWVCAEWDDNEYDAFPGQIDCAPPNNFEALWNAIF